MKKFNFKNKLYIGTKTKIFMVVVLVIMLLGSFTYVLRTVNSFFDTHYLEFHRVVQVEFNKPVSIEERETEMTEVIKIIETIPHPDDLEDDVEKYIYEVFGLGSYKMAIAVSKCEGLNHPPDGFNVNTNNSIDVGYMRINSIHFKTEGCSLLEVATPKGNIDCGYKIWDRADGEEGNGKGSFAPWVGYTNGCALTKYE